MRFQTVEASIDLVLKHRRMAWARICALQNFPVEDDGILATKISKVCILASSSRGGTAVTAELLQWQGANCTDPGSRLLTLPGEEKPHLILAGLAFPVRKERYDDLNESDAGEYNVNLLLEEMRSEIGYPMRHCENLELYATQLYRRFLLQWPVFLASVEMQDAIASLTKELQLTFPGGYIDSLENRRKTLEACAWCFPFIIPDYYDCWHTHTAKNEIAQSGICWSIEETPFVFPPPWRNASIADLELGTLLLRDPSNAWRLRFWRTVFKEQRMKILHLVRDPRESVQGLCDGWNYQYGFQTMPADHMLEIAGYTDFQNSEDSKWKLYRLNFSINKSLSHQLLDEQLKLSLVRICSYQWGQAHEDILRESEMLGLPRVMIKFSDLRKNTVETFQKICSSLELELSESGLLYAGSFKNNWVMVTPEARFGGHDRWKTSPFASEIKKLYSTGYFDSLSIALDLHRTWPISV